MPAYMLVQVKVTDPDQYAQYTKLTPAILEKYGGRFVIRGGEKHALEGPEIPERIVLLRFPDVAAAKRMYNSDEYQAAIKLREGAAEASFIVMAAMNKPAVSRRLVLFDIDGTLLISRGIGREAKRRAMLERFGEVGDLDKHVFGGKTDWQILADLLAPFGKTSADIGREIAAYQQAMARHMRGIKDDYRADALPHALELVRKLRDRGDAIVGLVTGNTAMTAEIKLEMAGFQRDWFAVGAFGNEAAERAKLTRLALARAEKMTTASFDGGDVFVIGDTVADIDAARAIDAVAVAVCTGYTEREQLREREPDFLLDDLSSFMAAVMV